MQIREHFLHFWPLRLVLAITAILAGASFCFISGSWHNSSTFYFVNVLPIPWWAYGVALLLAAVLICFEKTRPFGYLIGATIYTFFALAAWLAVIGSIGGSWGALHVPSWLRLPTGRVGNVFAAGNLSTISVVYWTAACWSVYKQVDPERKVVGK